MKALYIFKTGTTFPTTKEKTGNGDFDTWTIDTIGKTDTLIRVVDVEKGESLPDVANCKGVVITGSHSMVTEDLPWSVALEKWLVQAIDLEIPILGVCYGHQLLAKAMGGIVDYHPGGKEIGTVNVQLQGDAKTDLLFRKMPQHFKAHVTHAQTVTDLPSNTILLASNEFEPHHAFRVGKNAWGVQFHPEYTVEIMRIYVEEQIVELVAAGRNIRDIRESVMNTVEANDLLKHFIDVIDDFE